ncbi:MAG: SelB C-terminal domain-containing protein, partial [Acidimicrobiales bacterium]
MVEALTGTDPDRWAEEKARGLTIDLGFAHTEIDELVVSFVDVPGHVRFLANMLAGVGGVVACLFVVDALEGWKPQSEEHLRILELVGVEHGVIALTKVDRAGPDLTGVARLELADRVAGTFLADAEVVDVAAPAGLGLDELRAALGRTLRVTPAVADTGRPRLWVDRAFAAKGAGTIVTGTLLGGRVAVDDRLAVRPGGPEVRVRGIQAHHESVDHLPPGSRTALNLVGIEHDEVRRGQVVIRPGQWHETAMVDADLQVLATLGHRVHRRGAYVAHLGTAEQPVRLRVLGPDSVAPGATGLVRLHLATALPLLPGDRYVLRESGRGETVGGGEVLDVAPVLAATRAAPDRSVHRVIAERGWVGVDDLERLTGERRTPTLGPWVVDPDVLTAARATLTERIEAAGELGLDLARLDDRERAVLEGLDGVTVDGGRARAVGATDALADHPYLAALHAAPFAPPAPDGVAPVELRELARRGLAVQEGGIWFAEAAIGAAATVAARLLADRPQGFSLSDFREALGTSRKYAVPLATLLDGRGVTRRRDDLRIAGPRLP